MIQFEDRGFLNVSVLVLPDNGRYDPALKGPVTLQEIREFLEHPGPQGDPECPDYRTTWGRSRLRQTLAEIPWWNGVPKHDSNCACYTCDF